MISFNNQFLSLALVYKATLYPINVIARAYIPAYGRGV